MIVRYGEDIHHNSELLFVCHDYPEVPVMTSAFV
jgi:hypothetical protein